MVTTMRAVVLDGPGPATALQIRELPVPVAASGLGSYCSQSRSASTVRSCTRGSAWPRA